MTNYGLFITKEGKNVLEQQNILDYIVNTNYNTFKIYKIINGLITTSGTSSVAKMISHGLGYHPAFLSYYRLKKASQVWWLDHTSMSSGVADNDGYRSDGTQVNKSEINFSAKDGENVGASDIEFKGFLLINPISLIDSTAPGVPLTSGFGFKASKEGVDVLKAKAHELVLSSKYDSLKFHMEKMLSFTVTNPATSGSASFEHGLGYVPMFNAVAVDPVDTSKQKLLPLGKVPSAVAVSVKADRSSITAVAVTDGTVTITCNFRIIVLKNILSVA